MFSNFFTLELNKLNPETKPKLSQESRKFLGKLFLFLASYLLVLILWFYLNIQKKYVCNMILYIIFRRYPLRNIFFNFEHFYTSPPPPASTMTLAENNYFRLGYRLGSRALRLGRQGGRSLRLGRLGSRALRLGRQGCWAPLPDFIVLSGVRERGKELGCIKIFKIKINISKRIIMIFLYGLELALI
jgi:hypothetical protein